MSKDNLIIKEWFHVLSKNDQIKYIDMNHNERRRWFKQNRKLLMKRVVERRERLADQKDTPK